MIKDKKLLNKKIKRDKKSKTLQLLEQLEFYFSDSNLINDKFLSSLLSNDKQHGVEVAIIANFNKIKTILSDYEELDKRISFVKKVINKHSTSLVLNTLESKILRKEEFNPEKVNSSEIDNKTIYVENLPSTATHDLVTQIFSKAGDIAYISLPKFSETKLCKGFGFITFKVFIFHYSASRLSGNCH